MSAWERGLRPKTERHGLRWLALAVRLPTVPGMNLADGMSPAEREASMRHNSAVAAQVQQHARRVAQNTGGGVVGECAALDAHIQWIDAMARRPQAASTQGELTRDRKASRDRQFRLGCR